MKKENLVKLNVNLVEMRLVSVLLAEKEIIEIFKYPAIASLGSMTI